MWIIATVVRMPFVVRQYGADLLATARAFYGYIALIGAGSLATYLLILYAYTQGPVSYIIAARESSVVIGALLGWIFLKERLTAVKTIGILAIAGGLMLLRAS